MPILPASAALATNRRRAGPDMRTASRARRADSLSRRREPGIGELFRIGQVAQGLHPEGSEEGLGGDEAVGRTPAGFARAVAIRPRSASRPIRSRPISRPKMSFKPSRLIG